MIGLAALAAALGSGLAVVILGAAIPATPRLLGQGWRRLLALEATQARRAALPGVSGGGLLLAELVAAIAGAALGWLPTGMPALGLAGGGLAAGGVLHVVGARRAELARRRQDAVLEAVRHLRRLLETGGVGVPAALATLAERGPRLLRREFAMIVSAPPGVERQAWSRARREIDDPAFDLLAAAILVQRPAGGELAPLFSQLEESVAALRDVEREASALQVQARSAAALILALPLGFLTVMCSLRSPYLEPYRSLPGQIFLGLMLAAMGVAYVWIRRWLRLPEQPRSAVVE